MWSMLFATVLFLPVGNQVGSRDYEETKKEGMKLIYPAGQRGKSGWGNAAGLFTAYVYTEDDLEKVLDWYEKLTGGLLPEGKSKWRDGGSHAYSDETQGIVQVFQSNFGVPGPQSSTVYSYTSVTKERFLTIVISRGQGEKRTSVMLTCHPRPKTDAEKVEIAKKELQALNDAVKAYIVLKGQAPEDLADLTKPLGDNKPLLEWNALRDPWGRAYQYEAAGPNNKGQCPDIWTQGPSPDGKNMIGNWSLTKRNS